MDWFKKIVWCLRATLSGAMIAYGTPFVCLVILCAILDGGTVNLNRIPYAGWLTGVGGIGTILFAVKISRFHLAVQNSKARGLDMAYCAMLDRMAILHKGFDWTHFGMVMMLILACVLCLALAFNP